MALKYLKILVPGEKAKRKALLFATVWRQAVGDEKRFVLIGPNVTQKKILNSSFFEMKEKISYKGSVKTSL